MSKQQRRRQRDGFLNRYDFAYASGDTINTGINTIKQMAPAMIEIAGNKIDKVTEKRIAQTVRQGGKDVERVVPIALKKAIE